MIQLSVNLNKIALIRNSRKGNFPCVLDYANQAIEQGVQGITVHPRPDQRHIRADDIPHLLTLVAAYPNVEFNIEGNPFALSKGTYPGFIDLVLDNKPDQCTLVPDEDSQLTSDHGFDLRQENTLLREHIKTLKDAGIRVSLFMDPDIEQISLAKEIGADRIELYTGPFASVFSKNPESELCQNVFKQHCDAAEHAYSLGLGINAGHDLNLDNLVLYRSLPHLMEVSIGHALTVDALNLGYNNAIHAYLNALSPRA